MEESTKSPKYLIFVSSGLVILAILAMGETGQVKGGLDMFLNLGNFFTGNDSAVFEENFSQSMPAKTETDIDISHSHGNITVKGWDKDEVKLEGKKIVKARDEETARMYAEQMKVEIKSEDGRIIVKTIRPERDKAWEIKQITINYELYAPKRLNVTLKNGHGKVLVGDFTGKLDLNSRHGDLKVVEIGEDASIKHEHGSVDVSNVRGDASVSKRHGSLKIKSVGGKLKLSHEHGAVDLAMIGKGADLTKRHGKLSAVNVSGMLELDHEHGDVRLNLIEGDVEINKQHGNIDIETVNGNVSIHSEHGSLRIVDIKGDVHLRGAHGNAHVENVSGSVDASRSHSKVRLHSIKGVGSR